MEQQQLLQPHFLVVTHPEQGHINPARHLANYLARTTGSRVTFSTAVFSHRRMFPALTSPDQQVDDGLVTYIPLSGCYGDGFKPFVDDPTDYLNKVELNGSKSLSALIRSLAARGRPVTCLIYTLLVSWAADVAQELSVPSALYWIQPATMFAIYYHYFHGYESLISSHGDDPLFTVHLPSLPPFQIRDLPSFLPIPADDPFSLLPRFRRLFETLDRETARQKQFRILVNIFDALEPEGFAAVIGLKLAAIGPLLSLSKNGEAGGDLFPPDEKKYMEWLDTKPEGSVVYISFGSMSRLKKEQTEEIWRLLSESGRPYLWVVRKDNREEGLELGEDGEKGLVVGWCSQLRVLSHKAVGCFVTHCGWNSTLESLACGVPQGSDQATNARLAEEEWGTGVRAAVNAEGVVEAAEMRLCLDLVMGNAERGVEIRRKAATWQESALEAVKEGGSSDRNLKAFVEANEQIKVPRMRSQ